MCLRPFQSVAFTGCRGDLKTHGVELFLLSEEGNRKTNFAGCVNEQFEITNVTGMPHDLDANKGSEFPSPMQQREPTHPDPKSCSTTNSYFTLTTTGFEFTFHSPPLTACITSIFSFCVSAYMLLLTFALSASSIVLPNSPCSAPKVSPDTKTWPDRFREGISQNTNASTEAGLYNGKIVWWDELAMLGYALEMDCRTSFRLFCRTEYESSSEPNARIGSDYVKPSMSYGVNTARRKLTYA
jgi:hypothetical protein